MSAAKSVSLFAGDLRTARLGARWVCLGCLGRRGWGLQFQGSQRVGGLFQRALSCGVLPIFFGPL